MDATIFDRMADHPDFGGYGYIGGRLEMSDEKRAAADAMVLAEASGYSEAALFEWANSRPGRWYAEAWASDNRYGHAEKALPGRCAG